MRPNTLLLSAWLALTLAVSPLAWAQDPGAEAEEPTDTDEAEERKFDDRDRLVETLMADDLAARDDAQQALDEANETLMEKQEALDQAESDLDAARDSSDSELVSELEAKVTELETEISDLETAIEGDLEPAAAESETALEEERTSIEEQVAALDDEQVFAMNRSLNNALASGLLVDIDADELQMVLDGEYDKRQINAFTKAYEEEAKFNRLSDKFADRAETMDNPKFGDKAAWFEEKGQRQKDKFIAKIDRWSVTDDDPADTDMDAETGALYPGQARREARATGKEKAKETANAMAGQAAKGAAKAAAKKSAKGAAKSAARKAAKLAAKDAAKQAAKDNAKQNAKDAAQDAAKKAAKENARKAAKGKAKGKPS